MPSSGAKPEPELTWDEIYFLFSISSRLYFVIFENAPVAAELLAALTREVNVPGRIFQASSLPFPHTSTFVLFEH